MSAAPFVTLAEALRERGTKSRLFYAASSHCFGSRPLTPVQDESTPFFTTPHFDGHTSLLTSLADLGLHAERISSTTSARARTPFLPTPGSWEECSAYMFGQKEPQQAGE